MLKARVWLYLSLFLSNGAAANDVGISPTANGMADAYATHYGKAGDAVKIGICGRDDRQKVTTDSPEMFALASASGRMSQCKGGMSPFTYSFIDNDTNEKKDEIFLAATKHQLDACYKKYHVDRNEDGILKLEDKIKFQPNVHFREYNYNKDEWLKGYNIDILENSISYFENKNIDIVLYKILDEQSFLNDHLPDGTKRHKIPPIIKNISIRDIVDLFERNVSLTVANHRDLGESQTVRYYERGGNDDTTTRKISTVLGSSSKMAMNHSAYHGASGSPIYLKNSSNEIGLFGVITSGTVSLDGNYFSNSCLDENSPQKNANKFVPSYMIVNYLKEYYGEPAGPFLNF